MLKRDMFILMRDYLQRKGLEPHDAYRVAKYLRDAIGPEHKTPHQQQKQLKLMADALIVVEHTVKQEIKL